MNTRCILSPEEIEQVAQRIVAAGIRRKSLADDLLDHLCCSIELKVEAGQSFDDAFAGACDELGHLQKINFQTEIMFNPIQIIMKKVMYFIGLATTISMTIGIMFKLLHMPGGEELFNYGFLAFTLVFLPMTAISKFRQPGKRSTIESLRMAIGFLSALGVGAAVVLKLMSELDPAGIFLLVSVSIFCFGFLPLKFYELYREDVLKAERSS